MNEVIKLSNAKGSKVTEYLEKSEFVAEDTYLTYIDYFPVPYPTWFPKLYQEYDFINALDEIVIFKSSFSTL
jgi:hypothetical protein